MKELRHDSDSRIVVMLVGNKCDLKTQRQVTVKEGVELATKIGASFLETSALDATNVYESFRQVIQEIIRKQVVNNPHATDQSNFVHDSRQTADRIDIRAPKKSSSSQKCC